MSLSMRCFHVIRICSQKMILASLDLFEFSDDVFQKLHVEMLISCQMLLIGIREQNSPLEFLPIIGIDCFNLNLY